MGLAVGLAVGVFVGAGSGVSSGIWVACMESGGEQAANKESTVNNANRKEKKGVVRIAHLSFSMDYRFPASNPKDPPEGFRASGL